MSKSFDIILKSKLKHSMICILFETAYFWSDFDLFFKTRQK